MTAAYLINAATNSMTHDEHALQGASISSPTTGNALIKIYLYSYFLITIICLVKTDE